jgi:hypothetical protein
MGNFSLTNPGLAYDPGQGTDPSTGMPIQLPPIVKYFKNAALRGHQAALDEMAGVQPGRSSLSGPETSTNPTGAPQIAQPGQEDTNTATDTPAPVARSPKFVQPSFSSTTKDANGLPLPISPAETKLGKLVHILAAAGQGALAGWGTGNPGAGAAQAREIPIQLAEQHQQLQTGSLENQQRQANLRSMPLDIAQRQAAIEKTLQDIQGERYGAAQFIPRQDPQTGELVYQGIDHFGNPVGPGVKGYVSPYTLKPHLSPIAIPNPNDPNGQPIVANYNKLSGHVEDDQGNVIPGAEKFVSGLVPKTSTNTESSSTDLMGNTRTTNTRVTAPVRSATVPGVAPAGAAGSAPLRQANGSPQPAQPQPRSTTQPAKAPAGPTPSALSLSPDVEQRLAGSALSPQEKQYVRGLLNYQGQMPSPRAKNYAATLATLTAIDPNFNAANYDANKKTFMDYTPGGSVGKQAISFNTSIAHLDMLDQAAAALKNGIAPALNKIANFFKVQAGDSAVTTFNNIADAVDGEVSKTFKGTATEGELARVGAHFSSSLGPDQIQNNIRSTIGLLNGKMGEMQSAFQRQVGRPINMVSPEAQRAIQRMSGNGGGAGQLTFRDSRGGMHQISQQDWQANQAAIRQRDPGVQLIQ